MLARHHAEREAYGGRQLGPGARRVPGMGVGAAELACVSVPAIHQNTTIAS